MKWFRLSGLLLREAHVEILNKCTKRQLLLRYTYQKYAHYCTGSNSKSAVSEESKETRTRSRKTNKNHVIGSTSSSDTLTQHTAGEQETLSASLDNSDFKGSLSVEEFKTCLKRDKKHSYVFEAKVAEKLVKTILSHRTYPYAPMLEIGAGPGIVSREFLRQGVSKVVALEANKDFSYLLEAIQRDAGEDRFQTFSWQMLNLYLKLHSSHQSKQWKAYHTYESLVVEALQPSYPHQIDEPHSIFSIGGKDENRDLMYFIIQNLPLEDALLSQEGVEFFFLAHPRLKLFDADEFYPPFNAAKRKQNKGIDSTKRFLIKLKLKENISELLPLEQHLLFLNFLRQLYKKKLTRVIPTLEMLIPGCGLRLIAEGFTMLDSIVTSQPEDFLRIFKMMLEWPEYKTSPLHSHLMMKTTGSAQEEAFEADREEN